MRVLVIAAATYADVHTRKLFQHAADQGAEILLAMPARLRHPFAPGHVEDTPWPTPGVRLARLATWCSHENGTHVLMRGVSRLIKDFRPDIIHCVLEPWSLTCLQVLGSPSRARRRTKFGVQPCETKPEQGGAISRIIRGFLARRVLRRCDFFVGWSTAVVKAALRYGLDGRTVAVAPAVGVDTDLFRPAATGEKRTIRGELGFNEPDDFLVGYVGRFVEEKGLLDLLAAMDRAALAEPRLHLILLGAGPLETTLRAAAAARPWMRLMGPRNQEQLSRFLRALDLFVLSSRTTDRWEEQFGLVLVEAMASGVPVIGTACGAIPEVLLDTGWIVTEGDISALSACIVGAVGNPDDLESRSLVARRRAESSFSARVVSRRLMEIWATACAGAKP